MLELNELTTYLNNLLKIDKFTDYCPNGLQVSGKSKIKKIITGVSANLELIKAAIDNSADCILVHHGWFWKNESSEITSIKQQRLKLLLEHDINLLAYHLPLDAHLEYGNNVQLAKILNFSNISSLDPNAKPNTIGNIALQGKLNSAVSQKEFSDLISKKLNRAPLVINAHDKKINSIGWCTGAAQDLVSLAASQKLDAFLTGEISERNVHEAKELGINFYAIGHHASERYGVMALGAHLAENFKLHHQFIEIDNIV